jgi:hypothetical protein
MWLVSLQVRNISIGPGANWTDWSTGLLSHNASAEQNFAGRDFDVCFPSRRHLEPKCPASHMVPGPHHNQDGFTCLLTVEL